MQRRNWFTASAPLVVLALLGACSTRATEARPSDLVAEPAIHPVHTLFMDGIAAFNAHDLDVFMEQWGEDIEMYTPTGWLRGREAVRDRFLATFRDFPDVRMDIEDLRVRDVAPGVAVVDFRWATYPRGAGPAYRGVGSGVYVRRGDRWVEVVEHETVVSADEELRRGR